MQSKTFAYKVLFCASLALCSIYVYVYRKNIFYEGLLKHHGEIAYNVYRYNSLKINNNRIGAIYEREAETGQRADYYEIDHERYGPPTIYRNYYDSIGYGVLIGLLWKITHSLDYLDIQLLQLLLFSLLLLLFYQIALMLFDKRTALFSSITLLCFFPILYLNAQVMRDVWPYYSAVILAYTTLAFLYKKIGLILVTLGAITVALLQFTRPPAFMLIITISIVLLGYAITQKQFRSVLTLLTLLWGTNILFFWIPFAAYNKIAYDRYIVGPTGINVLEGLGEYPNPWGYQLSDGWYGNFMKENYPHLKTNLERDDQARALFWQAVRQEPLYYLTSVLKRIPRLAFPGLPSFNYQDTKGLYKMYLSGESISSIAKHVIHKPILLIDFLIRHVYLGLFLLLAYLGILLALIRKKYFACFFIWLGIIASSYPVILAHTEHRYLTPYYAFFAIFVGFLLSETTKRKGRQCKNSRVSSR